MNPLKRDQRYLRDDSFGIIGVIIVVYLLFQTISFIVTFVMNYWFLILLIVLVLIALTGIKNIPIGSKAVKIFMGKRTNVIVDEGFKWHIPFIENLGIVDCDCREQFIKATNMRLNLANLIPVTIFISASFKIDNVYNYFENYSKDDLDIKVTSDIMKNLREFLTVDKISVKELQSLKSLKFNQEQLDQINNHYLYKIGINITNISVESIHLDNHLEYFFTILEKADVLALEKGMEYTEALKASLIISGKIDNAVQGSSTMIEGLKQLKRLKNLSNE